MLNWLELENLGPCKLAKLKLDKRLTVITGDNGVEKSFFLDVAFWTLTNQWPAEINPLLITGMKALPAAKQEKAPYSVLCFRQSQRVRSNSNLRSGFA